MRSKKHHKKNDCHECSRHHDHDRECDHECDHDRRVEVADYVVVGLGTGGTPLVRHLVDAGFSVYAIEDGFDTRNDPLVENPAPLVLAPFPQYHLFYPADVGLLQPNPFVTTTYQMGRMWGGSSGHNFMTHVRSTPCLYNEWATISCDEGWRYENIRPIIMGAETFTPKPPNERVNTAERGVCGPVFITEQTEQPAPGEPFVAALARAGVPFSPDYNDPTRGVFVVGVDQSYHTPTVPKQRSWVAPSYLGEDIVERLPNGDGVGLCGRDLFIASNARADRLIFADELDAKLDRLREGDIDVDAFANRDKHHDEFRSRDHGGDGDPELTVVGVRYVLIDGTEVDVLARVKVILAAGAVEDPAILQRSGIGPCDVLERLGVEPRFINENVGRGGQNHIGIVGFYPANPGQAPLYLEAFNEGVGSRCNGCRQFQTIYYANYPTPFAAFFPPESVLAFGANLRPAHDVEVDAQSLDPREPPFIRFNYLRDADDQAAMIELAKIIGRVSIQYRGALPTSPPPEVFPNDAEFGPFGGLGSDATLLEWARTNAIQYTHISGTARMGCTPCDGVVDGNLDVFGVDGLGMVSNSVVPQIADGNTSWTALVTGVAKARIEGADVPEGNEKCCPTHHHAGCSKCDKKSTTCGHSKSRKRGGTHRH